MTKEIVLSSLAGFLLGCILFTLLLQPVENIYQSYPSYPKVETFLQTRGIIKQDAKLLDHIFKVSNQHAIDPYLIVSLIIVESNFVESAISNHGAIGLMQIMPKWHNVDVNELRDPYMNVSHGIRIYAEFLRKAKYNEVKALSKYNGDRSLKYAYKVLGVRAAMVRNEKT